MREFRKAPWLSRSVLAAARDRVTVTEAGPEPEEGDTEAQEGRVLDGTDHLVPAGTTCPDERWGGGQGGGGQGGGGQGGRGTAGSGKKRSPWRTTQSIHTQAHTHKHTHISRHMCTHTYPHTCTHMRTRMHAVEARQASKPHKHARGARATGGSQTGSTSNG